jgi:multisubunit Na+/H+ antiporter MnhF subunit
MLIFADVTDWWATRVGMNGCITNQCLAWRKLIIKNTDWILPFVQYAIAKHPLPCVILAASLVFLQSLFPSCSSELSCLQTLCTMWISNYLVTVQPNLQTALSAVNRYSTLNMSCLCVMSIQLRRFVFSDFSLLMISVFPVFSLTIE